MNDHGWSVRASLFAICALFALAAPATALAQGGIGGQGIGGVVGGAGNLGGAGNAGDALGGGADDKLKNAGPKVEQHIKAILDKYQGAEAYGKQIAEKIQQDGKSKQWKANVGRAPGSKRHPWDPNGNPNSENDYKIDSVGVLVNEQANLTEVWSGFEPGRVIPGSELDLICDRWCPDSCFGIPTFGQNKHEVIEYWLPEHVAYINDYGINRLKPSQQSAKGDNFEKPRLVANKEQSERRELELLEQKKALLRAYVVYPDRSENKGQGENAGVFGGFDFTQKFYAHGARTRYAYKVANAALGSSLGWFINPLCIADSFPPKTAQKDILNAWTESGNWDVLWNMPEMTDRLSQREKNMYKATAPPVQPIDEAGKNGEDWLKNKSPAAYRAGRWPDRYGDLKDAGFGKSNDPNQREFVLYNVNLGPLTGITDGTLGLPDLSAGALLARRAFYIMGSSSRQLKAYHTDGEKGRMVEYTVLERDKGREVDKMMRIWPREGLKPSEAFRSQRIPNMIDTTQDQWAKKHFPHDMIKYVDTHFGEQTYAFWNKRVSCTCKLCSLPGLKGCNVMDIGTPGRGTGDQPYGKFELVGCKYRRGLFPSAFEGRDVTCQDERPNYKGLEDDV